MEAGVIAAIISACVAIGLAVANSFIAERYRRFHDGSALAAALAGEIGSYRTAWPLVRMALIRIIEAADAGQKLSAAFRPFERPRDRVYDESIGRLGLLGSDLVEGIVYVYGNLGSFRLAFDLIVKEHPSMSSEEMRERAKAALACLDRAVSVGAPLLDALQKRAGARFLQRRQPKLDLPRFDSPARPVPDKWLRNSGAEIGQGGDV